MMRILVVEDQPDLQRAIVASLSEQGYAVDASDDGEDALSKALSFPYSAVVLDMMLPKLDGWSVLTRLREKKQTPVIVLTARDSVDDRVRGLDTGADDYLVKPFELAELNARLRALIRRAAGKSRSKINLGRVVIDAAARQVSCDGAPIDLTAREYALVELLALNSGTVVTRATIYEQLFSEDTDTLSNLVEVHVSNIRKKLGKDFIVTRRGHGYLVREGAVE